LTPVDDDLYRILIKVKIAINNSDMIVDSMLEIISSTFDVKVSYYLISNLNPMYEIGMEFTPFEQELLKNFPTTLGVKKIYYSTAPSGEAFAFDGDSDGLGFADNFDPNNGGYFSNLIIT